MKNLSLIAAIGKNRELGKDNDLIWRFSEDMQFFKKNTINKSIIMGKKTLDSLPKRLLNREYIVLTHRNLVIPNTTIVHSKEELLNLCKKYETEMMVIGGASIYKLLIEEVNRMLLTEINATCDSATVFFPEFNELDWNKKILSHHQEQNINYQHVEYTRKKVRR